MGWFLCVLLLLKEYEKGLLECFRICMIINLIIFFSIKRGYGSILGYIEKCVGFAGMLFNMIINLKSRK